jgi:hypothetical protein
MKEHTIQDFAVTSGVLARNDQGLIEGRLSLANDVAFVFVMGKDGAQWYWQPDEPPFAADRLGFFGSDVDQPAADELRLLAEHGITASDFARIQMLDVAQDDLQAAS